MKVAVFAQNRDFFGAKVVHIPMLFSIWKKYDEPKITVYTPYINNDFFMRTGIVERVVYYDKNFLKLWKDIRNENYDIIYSLRPESEWLNIIISLSSVDKVYSFKNFFSFLNCFKENKKYTKNMYRAVEFNLLVGDFYPIDAYFSSFEEKRLFDKKTIFIIPGGGESFKIWKIENFISVCRLIGNNYSYCFVLGEKEKRYVNIINSLMLGFEYKILLNVDFRDLVSYFKSACLFISNDCGPSHIAQIMQKPIVILYSDIKGDADKVITEWFYPHKQSRFIKSERYQDINTIKVENVLDKVRSILCI